MTLIVYGAACTWWDVKTKAWMSSTGTLSCPHCKGPVIEEEEAVWLATAQAHSDEHQPGYLVFLLALQGARCIPHTDLTRLSGSDDLTAAFQAGRPGSEGITA